MYDQVHLGRSGQVHFDPSSEPALRQCHETSLTFSGDRADFGQCEEVVSFFIGLFCEEKGTFGFLGALSLSKSPKSQKGPFSNMKNDTTSSDWPKSALSPLNVSDVS